MRRARLSWLGVGAKTFRNHISPDDESPRRSPRNGGSCCTTLAAEGVPQWSGAADGAAGAAARAWKGSPDPPTMAGERQPGDEAP
jgi:hypothetical protein